MSRLPGENGLRCGLLRTDGRQQGVDNAFCLRGLPGSSQALVRLLLTSPDEQSDLLGPSWLQLLLARPAGVALLYGRVSGIR